MINSIPVAFIFIVGSFLIPFLKGKIKLIYLLTLPVIAFINLVFLSQGQDLLQFGFLDYTLILNRIDKLSLIFGYIFILVTFIGVIYAIRIKDDTQHIAAFCYAGGALGVTFAGDLISLYFFWELMAVASCILILAKRTKSSRNAAFRYFMWHFFGGIILLSGIVLYVSSRGTIAFSYIGLSDLGTYLIFVGFCLNAAIFPLHSWLPDAYPKATISGAVFMSALTTKTAVYVLVRTYPGSEILMWVGAFMACFPIFYAVIANDMRRILSYSLMNQVGFMICGIGIGTQLAINGVVAHAISCIIYTALLFMSIGAVIHQTGKVRTTDLGGLYKTMPITAVFCMIGAASISAFPLFSGFISKSITVSAVAENHEIIIYLMLLFASAGAVYHAGIKIPYFVFFGKGKGLKNKEAPLNMHFAMGIAALVSIFLGVYPTPFYNILPFPITYIPYTFSHIIGILELLMFGTLTFIIFIRSGFFQTKPGTINLDTDWFFRIPGRAFIKFCDLPLKSIEKVLRSFVGKIVASVSSTPVVLIKIDEKFDKVFHKILTAFPSAVYTWMKPLKTESLQISWNLFYILACFIFILIFIMFLGG